MRTALDLLLARPSTLRLLRRIAATLGLPRTAPRRHLSAQWPTHDRTQHGAYEKQETADNPADSEKKILAEKIRRAIQEKLRSTPEQETTMPVLDVAQESRIEAWIEIIQRMKRIHESPGVKTAWEIMREEQVDLPTSGPQADVIWELLITEEELLDSVVSYAFEFKARTGQAYKKLYESIIASFFAKRKHPQIYEWHDRLIHDFPPGPGALKVIASHMFGSTKSYTAFRWIYYRNRQRDVYDTIIPVLLEQGKLSMARNMQVWLLSRGDFPKGSRRVEEIGDLNIIPSPSRDHRYSREKRTQDIPHPFDTTAIYVGHLEAIGMRPKKVDDAFCARLMATKALTINFAVSCILAMDCNELGPLSMREMAFRSGDCKSVVENVYKIFDAGMTIKNTTYCRAIMRFALQSNQDLLQSLLENDQHPDNFDDEELQHKLLNSYIRAKNGPRIKLTLAMLTILRPNPDNISSPDPDSVGWNIMLRSVSKTRDDSWNSRLWELSRLLEEGQSKGYKMTKKTLDSLREHLRSRKPGHGPTATPEPRVNDDIWFANVCCSALKTGVNISPQHWQELLRRFGMTERFDHVYYLALWLANFYMTTHNLPEDLLRDFNHHFKTEKYYIDTANPASQGVEPRQPTDLRPSQPGHPLRQIFSRHQVRAFVAWSIRRDFIQPRNPKKKRAHFWARGLVLLRRLRQSGVYVGVNDVRKELYTQLLGLFGRDDPLLRRNRRARRNNPYTLAEMVRQANEAYGSFPEGAPGELLLDLEKTREYILATDRPRLWRLRPKRRPKMGGPRTTRPKIDLWGQLGL